MATESEEGWSEHIDRIGILVIFTLLVMYIFRKQLLSWLFPKKPRTRNVIIITEEISTEKECLQACHNLHSGLEADDILVFECDWRENSHINYICLHSGIQVSYVFKIASMGRIPACLRSILTDSKILKIGVNTNDNCKKLESQYSVRVKPTLDVRFLGKFPVQKYFSSSENERDSILALFEQDVNGLLPKLEKIRWISTESFYEADCRKTCENLVSSIQGVDTLVFDCFWRKDLELFHLYLYSNISACCIFVIQDVKKIPNCLKSILTDSKILKIGVYTYENCKKLESQYSIRVEPTLDVRFLAKSPVHGLADLAEQALNKIIPYPVFTYVNLATVQAIYDKYNSERYDNQAISPELMEHIWTIFDQYNSQGDDKPALWNNPDYSDYYNADYLDCKWHNLHCFFYEFIRIGHKQYETHPHIPNTKGMVIFVIQTIQECEYACRLLLRDCQTYIRALGFDCGWDQFYQERKEVAIVQLCSPSGTCCLFRLNLLNCIPQSLADILSDRTILKVGVSPYLDGPFLLQDNNFEVNSTLDLRYCYSTTDELASLASKHLGIKRYKDPGIYWSCPILTKDEKEYAAKDAYAGIELFKKWISNLTTHSLIRHTADSFYDVTTHSKVAPHLNRVFDVNRITQMESAFGNVETKRTTHDQCNSQGTNKEAACSKNPDHSDYLDHKSSLIEIEHEEYEAHPRIPNTKGMVIFEITNTEECEYACRLLLRDCQTYIRALGFDCEWVQWGQHSSNVDLLQLCSPSGTCCLFRLNLLRCIPQSLAEILSDRTILKVGVSSYRDGQHLFKDYSVQVQSILDLRYCYNTANDLVKLAGEHVGIKLCKDPDISAGKWYDEVLSRAQREYAAKDAYAGIELFKKWANNLAAPLIQDGVDTLDFFSDVTTHPEVAPHLNRVFDVKRITQMESAIGHVETKRTTHDHCNTQGNTNEAVASSKNPDNSACYNSDYSSDGKRSNECDSFYNFIEIEHEEYELRPYIPKAEGMVIFEITNTQECEYACRLFFWDCQMYIRALGFDCEWVQYGQHRSKVTLVKLCSPSGICCLFRLNMLLGIPEPLAAILCNKTIIKVGVSSYRDGQYLFKDYSVPVHSTLDLGYCYNTANGLAELVSEHLGTEFHFPSLRLHATSASYRECAVLSTSQREYSAIVAYAGIELFKNWVVQLARRSPAFCDEINSLSPRCDLTGHPLVLPNLNRDYNSQGNNKGAACGKSPDNFACSNSGDKMSVKGQRFIKIEHKQHEPYPYFFTTQGMVIFVVRNIEECEYGCRLLLRNCRKRSTVLGFDCEWVQYGQQRNKVALLQLCSPSGFCCLFRLNILNFIPVSLAAILSDWTIIKVGVATCRDARYLSEDYCVEVKSTLDLRHCYHTANGLAKLASEHVGFELCKDPAISASNWESPVLSRDQKEYAAKDAYAGVLLFGKWRYDLTTRSPAFLDEINSAWPPSFYLATEPFVFSKLNCDYHVKPITQTKSAVPSYSCTGSGKRKKRNRRKLKRSCVG